MRRFEINAPHNDAIRLRGFTDALPTSFDEGGTTVWNGRNKIKIFTLPSPTADGKDIQIVVKRYKRPNFLQKVGYLMRRHKADKAFHNALQLIERGFATPEPLAFVELRRGRWWLTDAYYICGVTRLDNIEGQTDRPDWNRDLAAAFAHFVAELHNKGVLHHDLNDTNVLYERNESGEYRFEVIDINRMTFYAPGDEIPLNECIENLTRFTGRIDLFEFVARHYAAARKFETPEIFVARALAQKKRHDRRWHRRKAFLHKFNRKKQQKKI